MSTTKQSISKLLARFCHILTTRFSEIRQQILVTRELLNKNALKIILLKKQINITYAVLEFFKGRLVTSTLGSPPWGIIWIKDELNLSFYSNYSARWTPDNAYFLWKPRSRKLLKIFIYWYRSIKVRFWWSSSIPFSASKISQQSNAVELLKIWFQNSCPSRK